jgi:ABC-type phosphate transport system substrate-binding protein
MGQRRILGTVLSVLCLLTPCLAHHMAVVTDKENKTDNVTSAQLAKIFKGETKKWPDGRNVVLVMRGSSEDEIGTLARLTKMTDAEVKAMLAERKDVRKVATDADVTDAVASIPGAIGMIEEHSITDRVKVIKVDGKLPLEAGYLPH